MNVFSKVFGSRSQREVKRIMPLVEKIESLRPDMQKLSDEELRGKTREFKIENICKDDCYTEEDKYFAFQWMKTVF